MELGSAGAEPRWGGARSAANSSRPAHSEPGAVRRGRAPTFEGLELGRAADQLGLLGLLQLRILWNLGFGKQKTEKGKWAEKEWALDLERVLGGEEVGAEGMRGMLSAANSKGPGTEHRCCSGAESRTGLQGGGEEGKRKGKGAEDRAEVSREVSTARPALTSTHVEVGRGCVLETQLWNGCWHFLGLTRTSGAALALHVVDAQLGRC